MNIIFSRSLLLSLLFLAACRKNNFGGNNTATLNVFNGIIQKDVRLKINERINNSGANSSDSRQNLVSYASNAFYYAAAENTPLSILNKTDSSTLVSTNINLEKGGIYTLLLAGVAPNVETALIDDTNLPYVNLSTIPSVADSVVNVRFINLAPDVPNIDVRIQGASSMEFTTLAYKAASSWKTYPALVTNGFFMRFEFVQNGTVLGAANVVFSRARFKNVALVLTGRTSGNGSNGNPGLAVSTMNYYQ